jgi:hypothetical protein
MKNYYDQIRALGKRSNKIYEDTKMSAERKAKDLAEIDDQILHTAKQANKYMEDHQKKK